MRVVLPPGDLGALKARIEQQFAITIANHCPKCAAEATCAGPHKQLSLLAEPWLKLRPEAPSFSELLVFSNREIGDPEPFVEGYAPDCWLVDLSAMLAAKVPVG